MGCVFGLLFVDRLCYLEAYAMKRRVDHSLRLLLLPALLGGVLLSLVAQSGWYPGQSIRWQRAQSPLQVDQATIRIPARRCMYAGRRIRGAWFRVSGWGATAMWRSTIRKM